MRFKVDRTNPAYKTYWPSPIVFHDKFIGQDAPKISPDPDSVYLVQTDGMRVFNNDMYREQYRSYSFDLNSMLGRVTSFFLTGLIVLDFQTLLIITTSGSLQELLQLIWKPARTHLHSRVPFVSSIWTNQAWSKRLWEVATVEWITLAQHLCAQGKGLGQNRKPHPCAGWSKTKTIFCHVFVINVLSSHEFNHQNARESS